MHPRETYYLEGDAADLEAEMDRYVGLLSAGPIDLAFVGFGENGHIAFNDPAVADFNDPLIVKRARSMSLPKSTSGEGHFPDLESVPTEALTITCTGLFQAKAWVCSVPDARKAECRQELVGGRLKPARLTGSTAPGHLAVSGLGIGGAFIERSV